MPNKRKKFIDPKSSQSFQVIHRSQKDPLIVDDEVNQLVLLPIENRSASKSKKKKPTINIHLPETLLPTVEEEEVGLLNLAAPIYGPRPDLDPDVVAGLDDDFDFSDVDNQLEDDFLKLAGGVDEDKEEIDLQELQNCMMNGYISEEYSDIDSDDCQAYANEEDNFFSKPYEHFNLEETKSHFTDYSMTSSVIPRSEALQTLDDRFEKFFEKYDDNDIGALDGEDIEGFIPPTCEMLARYLNIKFHKDSAIKKKEAPILPNLNKIKYTNIKIEEPFRETCESVIGSSVSSYCPHIITEPSLGKVKLNRHGIPSEGLKNGKLTIRNLKDHNNAPNKSFSDDCVSETLSQISLLSIRPKDETPEERKNRKKALKYLRQERRQEKKANTLLFKEEKGKLCKSKMHNRLGVILENK